jgi:bla regulator protein blaR1
MTIVNHLWQSTLVAVVAWGLCRGVLTDNHPRVRFVVWLIALLKFLVPFSLFVDLGRLLRMPAFVTPTQSQQLFELVSGGRGPLASVPLRLATSGHSSSAASDVWPIVIAGVWIAGAAVVLLSWLRAWFRIERAAAGAHSAGQFRGIPVFLSATMKDARVEPGIVGIWHPSILLPAGIDEGLTDAQLRSVLLHEWHHARRYDNLTATLQMIVEAVFWFYPVVWWIGRQLLDEREKACDCDVLEDATRDDYAASILNVCKWYVRSPLPCVAGITGADLRARVESVLHSQRPARLTATKRSVLGATVFATIAVPMVVGRLTESMVFAQAQTANSFLGMATTAAKSFEVATIKRNESGPDGPWHLGPPGRGSISIANLPLRSIIIQSFRTQRWMVFGGPDWINQERFDIVGKGPDPTATNPEVWEMMRSLLIERFHLKYHVEDREMAVLALTIAKGGPKLIPGEKGRCAEEIKQQRPCGDILIPRFGAAMYNMPVGALVTSLTGRAGRPVVDKTGLTGRYDITLSFMPEGMTHEQWESLPAEGRPEEMSMFEALERQGGLKLEPSRASMPVLVIDSVDRPTEN